MSINIKDVNIALAIHAIGAKQLGMEAVHRLNHTISISWGNESRKQTGLMWQKPIPKPFGPPQRNNKIACVNVCFLLSNIFPLHSVYKRDIKVFPYYICLLYANIDTDLSAFKSKYICKTSGYSQKLFTYQHTNIVALFTYSESLFASKETCL